MLLCQAHCLLENSYQELRTGPTITLEPEIISSCVGDKRFQFSSVQSLSHVQLFATPWTAACQVSLSITNSQSLLKLMPIESVMPSNLSFHLLSSLSPPTVNLSQHQDLFW